MPELKHPNHDGLAFERVGNEVRARLTLDYRHASWDGVAPAQRPYPGPLIVRSANQHPSSGTLPAWLADGDLYLYTGGTTPVLHAGAAPAPRASFAELYAQLVPSDAETTYFVDFAAGSNGADGRSRGSAFATLGHALAVAEGGEVIKVLNGTWNSASQMNPSSSQGGSAGNPVEVWAESLHGATLNVTGQDYVIRSYAPYVHWCGLRFTGATYFGIKAEPQAVGTAVRFCRVEDLLWPDENGSTGAAHISMHGDGGLVEHNIIIGPDVVNPGNTYQRAHGIYLRYDDHVCRNNLVVRIRFGNGIQVYDGSAAQDNIVVVNNTIVNCYNYGLILDGTNLVCANNIVYGARYGVRLHAGSSALIRRNLFANLSVATFTDSTGSHQLDEPILADPAFVDYQPDGSGDYRPQANSPAVDAADPSHAPARDLEHRLRDALPDVGAFEYGA